MSEPFSADFGCRFRLCDRNPSCARIHPKGAMAIVLDFQRLPFHPCSPKQHLSTTPNARSRTFVLSCDTFLACPYVPARRAALACARTAAVPVKRRLLSGGSFLWRETNVAGQTQNTPRHPTARPPQRPHRPRADAQPTVQHTSGRKTKKMIASESLQSQLPIYSFMR